MALTRFERGVVLSMEPGAEPLLDATVLAEGNLLTYVGPSDQAPASLGAQVVDCGGGAVLPGLVNAHTHLAMTLLRGFADDMPLPVWLEQKIWPTETKLTGEDVYWGSLLGVCEMLRGGVTCSSDMYHFFREATQAARDGDLRACPSGVLIGFLPNAADLLEDAVAFVRELRQEHHPRLHPMLAPHAPYTCPDAMLEQVAGYATELGVPIHIHVSETARELADSLADHGETPPARLARLGVLDCRVAAAHCVHLTEEDIVLLAAQQVGIAHCPGSNLKLASGFAPIPQLLAAGAVVGLGTDGCASNNNLDLFQEILLAGIVHKAVSGDPTAVTAQQALAMATREGARALGLGDLIGTLTPGKRADLIVVDLSRPHLQPPHNLVSHLAYSARADDVKLTMVDGEILYRDGKLTRLDEAEIIARANECAARLVR